MRPVSSVYAVRMAGMSGPAKMYSVYCPPAKLTRYSSGREKSYQPRKPLSTNDPDIVPVG